MRVFFAFFCLSVFSYFFLDKETAFLFSSPPYFVEGVSRLISFLTTPSLYLIAGAFAALYTRKKEPLLLTSIVFTVTGVLKVLCARARPELLVEKGIYGFYPGTFSSHFRSFPSAHTAMIIGVLTFCFLQKKTSYVWWILPLAVAMSRIFLQKHYVSDLFMGAAIGVLSAQVVYFLDKRKAGKEILARFKIKRLKKS